MKLYLGVTDSKWYQCLSDCKPDEVNFWQPGGKQAFKALQPNDLFLFKLHSPLNYIAGGGFFVRHALLPSEPDPIIGCIILSSPFFFERSEWIPVPEDWSPNIVQGKSYDTNTLIGKRLFNQIQDKLNRIVRSTDVAYEVRRPSQLYLKWHNENIFLG